MMTRYTEGEGNVFVLLFLGLRQNKIFSGFQTDLIYCVYKIYTSQLIYEEHCLSTTINATSLIFLIISS